jgi:putative DNA primase/helicase
MLIDKILKALDKAGKTYRQTDTNQWQVQCPAHDDNNPSLTITEKPDKVLLYCHAGCKTEAVLEKLNLDMTDLFIKQTNAAAYNHEIDTSQFRPDPIDVSRPIVVSLADVNPLPIDWLWFNRIPLGMLTLLLGDPGLGKSFFTLYMASRISTGGMWPDNETQENYAPKGSVVILTAEDDLAHVVRPRLDALGADVTKIVALEGVKITDENDCEHCEYFSLQRDLPALQQAVQNQKDTKLVVIDPLSAYLGGRIDSHKDSDVRSVLRPLVELAEKCGVAVIGVTHLNKNFTGKAVYRAMGSLAFLAAARTCWLVTADPNNTDSGRRLLTPAKHNVLIEPTGLAFETVDGKVVFENEPVTITADEALGKAGTIEAPALKQAKQWLSEQLTPGKSMFATEIYRLADEERISRRTLERAKKELHIVSYPQSMEGKKVWFWGKKE